MVTAEAEITLQEVSLPSGTQTLAATLTRPDVTSGGAVLFVHGLGSSRATNVERAAAVSRSSATTCLAIDLAGHGDSTGRLTEMTPRQNLADVVAGYDWLASQPEVDRGRIGLCAASYGAYLSILVSALRPVSRMLLRAPALYADDCFDRGLAQRKFGDQHTAPIPLAHLTLFPGAVTVVESENDEIIDPRIVRAYVSAQPRATHVVQPGASHALTDPRWRSWFQAVAVDFFVDL